MGFAAGSPHRPATVLVVEDDPGVRQVMARALRAGGCAVLEAADGVEALRLAAVALSPIDLLVADVILPGVSGPALAGLLSAAQPGIQVLLVSGYSAEEVAGAVRTARTWSSCRSRSPPRS